MVSAFGMAHSEQRRAMVLIASPSVLLRKRWSRSVQLNLTTHEVANQAAMHFAVERLHPSVVLLDEKLLRPRRTETLPKLVKLAASTKFILVVDHPCESEGLSALKSGVKGYCGKHLKPLLLRKAVQTVQAGEPWIGRKLTAALIKEFCRLSVQPAKRACLWEENQNISSLTRRELDVARLVRDGARNREISSQLGISEKTVKFHLTAIFRKLLVSDRLGLALLLVENDHTSVEARRVAYSKTQGAPR